MLAPGAVAAVLTAAGASSRMGRPKALLDWNGLPLMRHQLQALAGLGEVVVVLGAHAEVIAPLVPAKAPFRTVFNPAWPSGRAGSLRAGFEALSPGASAILVVAVDQPIAAGVLEALLAGYDGAPIAVPVHEGRRGHPVLFRGDLWPELCAIDEEGQGLRAVTARHRAWRQEIPVPSAAITLDLNTPAEWTAARAHS